MAGAHEHLDAALVEVDGSQRVVVGVAHHQHRARQPADALRRVELRLV